MPDDVEGATPQVQTNAFGLEAEGTPEPEFLKAYEEPEAPEETPEEPEAQPEAEVEAPQPEAEQPEVEPEAEPEPAAEESSEPEAEPETPAEPELILGRFKSQDDLAAAYRNVETWATRTAQEKATIQAELERHKQMLATVAPVLERLEKQEQPQVEFDPDDPESVQRAIAAEAQRQAQALVAQQMPAYQQQVTDQVRAQERNAAIAAFAAAHPDAVTDPSLERDMERVIRAFRYDPDESREVEDHFPVTTQNLEIAHTLAREPQVEQMAHGLNFIPSDLDDVQVLREAVANPGLAAVLKGNPGYLENGEHDAARQLAQMLAAHQSASAGDPAARQAAAAVEKKRAFVESGSTAAPVQGAPGEEPKDPDDYDFSDVLAVAQQDRDNRFGI